MEVLRVRVKLGSPTNNWMLNTKINISIRGLHFSFTLTHTQMDYEEYLGLIPFRVRLLSSLGHSLWKSTRRWASHWGLKPWPLGAIRIWRTAWDSDDREDFGASILTKPCYQHVLSSMVWSPFCFASPFLGLEVLEILIYADYLNPCSSGS